MDLIESINFLDQHWDECINDESISYAIENNSDILSLQEHFLNSISQEVQQNQYSQLETSIADINNIISSISASTNDGINLLIKSQNQISTITHVKDFKNSEFVKIKRNIQEANSFYKMLNDFNDFRFPRYKKGNDSNNFNLLEILIKFRDMFNEEIIKLFQKDSNRLDDFIDDTLNSIKEDIIKAFLNRELSNNQSLELYRKYYLYIKRLTLPNKIGQLAIFQNSCIESATKGILKKFLKIDPSFFDKIIPEKFHRGSTFNYKDERIRKICELVDLTPKSIPQINYNVDPLELRIVYFIVNLPQIFEEGIYELYQIFKEKSISKKFLNSMAFNYQKLLDPKNIHINSEQNKAMFWCFLFSISSVHRITFHSSSLYTSKIIEIIDITINISFNQANLLYYEFIKKEDDNTQDTNKNTIISFLTKKKLSKIYSLSFDSQKYGKCDDIQKQKIRDDYVDSFMEIMKVEIFPISQCVLIFYDIKSEDRDNFKSTWYDQMIDTQKNCKWFTEYYLEAQMKLIVYNIDMINLKFDEKNILFMFCMLSYYTKCSQGLRLSSMPKFYNGFFIKKMKNGKNIDLDQFNESQNIQPENIVDILFTYKSSANNAVKYLNLFKEVAALYTHMICKMISEKVTRFIYNNYDKKDQDLNLLIHEIFASFQDFVIKQLYNYALHANKEIKIDINQLQNDIKQRLKNIK